MHDLAEVLGLPPIAGLVQYGRNRWTARFTLVLADDRRVHLGGIDGLWVQDRFARTILIALSIVPRRLSPEDWRDCLRVAFAAIEVDDAAEPDVFAEAA